MRRKPWPWRGHRTLPSLEYARNRTKDQPGCMAAQERLQQPTEEQPERVSGERGQPHAEPGRYQTLTEFRLWRQFGVVALTLQ